MREEDVKWQTPIFTYRGDLATFFPKSKQHAGAPYRQA
jgi:hypothetical protein